MVQNELAAHDDEPLDAHLETPTPAAALSSSKLRDVVTAGALRRVRVRVDAEPQPFDPHLREHEAVPAQRGKAGANPGARHLEKGWGVRGRPGDAKAKHLDLEREDVEAQPLDSDRAVEVAAESVLDEPRSPVGSAPERVEGGDDDDEAEKEERPSA
jgi:hypothetical protein